MAVHSACVPVRPASNRATGRARTLLTPALAARGDSTGLVEVHELPQPEEDRGEEAGCRGGGCGDQADLLGCARDGGHDQHGSMGWNQTRRGQAAQHGLPLEASAAS
ncbi:hypothetical protein [Streptomyces sp. NRRL S-1022]|uniref:hypothetical protein n=1 Tax=Streptomyces sp. NRRL S-1022 TaxID=1463880 RepID=UPI0018FEB7F3|nr:hypothetical protein [Streptomyces sp. NRRL S-1022]